MTPRARHRQTAAWARRIGALLRCAAPAFLCLALFSASLTAQEVGSATREAQTGGSQSGGGDARLLVGVVDRAPYAVSNDGAAWQGLGVDFWRVLAEAAGLSYRLVALDGQTPLAALREGAFDVVLPVAATPELEESATLLPPFYTATMGVVRAQGNPIFNTLGNLLSFQFLQIVLWVSAILLLVGVAMWLIERRCNSEQFAPRPLRGLGDGFWWAGVTLTTIGYGDKAPISFWGRAVAMVWMLAGLGISSALTASVVAATDLRPDAKGAITLPDDLRGATVAVVEGSSTERWLDASGLDLLPVASVAEAVVAVRAGSADAAAANMPELQAEHDEEGRLTLSSTTADPAYMSIALSDQIDAETAEMLRRAARAYLLTESWWQTVHRYLPQVL